MERDPLRETYEYRAVTPEARRGVAARLYHAPPIASSAAQRRESSRFSQEERDHFRRCVGLIVSMEDARQPAAVAELDRLLGQLEGGPSPMPFGGGVALAEYFVFAVRCVAWHWVRAIEEGDFGGMEADDWEAIEVEAKIQLADTKKTDVETQTSKRINVVGFATLATTVVAIVGRFDGLLPLTIMGFTWVAVFSGLEWFRISGRTNRAKVRLERAQRALRQRR